MANNDPKSTKCTQINKQQGKKNNKLHEINFAFEFQLFSFTSALSLFGVFGVYKFRRSFCSAFVRSCCLFSFFLLLFFVQFDVDFLLFCMLCLLLFVICVFLHAYGKYVFFLFFISFLARFGYFISLHRSLCSVEIYTCTHIHSYMIDLLVSFKYSHSLGTV